MKGTAAAVTEKGKWQSRQRRVDELAVMEGWKTGGDTTNEGEKGGRTIDATKEAATAG